MLLLTVCRVQSEACWFKDDRFVAAAILFMHIIPVYWHITDVSWQTGNLICNPVSVEVYLRRCAMEEETEKCDQG